MIQVTLPDLVVAPYRHLETVPYLEEWAHEAWLWQATWAPYTLAKLMSATPAGTSVEDHVTRHFQTVGDRCWEMVGQITQTQTAALPANLSGQERQSAESGVQTEAEAIVRAEWVQIPKEVPFPAYDPEIDPEMFLVGELEYVGKAELVEGVVWSVQNATSLDQPTPVNMTVGDLQAVLDRRLSRLERHLVFSDASRWAQQAIKKMKPKPEALVDLAAYPVPPY